MFSASHTKTNHANTDADWQLRSTQIIPNQDLIDQIVCMFYNLIPCEVDLIRSYTSLVE